MQAAVIIEILKVEIFRNVYYYYDLKYQLNGEIRLIEWFSENKLMVGDIIYI